MLPMPAWPPPFPRHSIPVIRLGPVSGTDHTSACGGDPDLFTPSVMIACPAPAPLIVRRLLVLTLVVHVHWPAGIATVSPSRAELRACAPSAFPQVAAVMGAAKAVVEWQ